MIYSVILKNISTVGDYSEEEGDFQEVLIKVLKANKNKNEFYYIPYLHYGFFFSHKDDYTFASISNTNIGIIILNYIDQEKAFLFLNTLQDSFFGLCINDKQNFTYTVTKMIKELMGQFKDYISNDKIELIEHELKVIQKQKEDNIKAVFEKENILDNLLTKSDNLKKTVKFF